jgi:putative ABC transport system permease protein
MAALTWRDYDLTGSGGPEHLEGMEVSAGFFSTLGVKPVLGREFSADEDLPHGAPAVIISNRLWKERFSSNPQALGQSITLDGASMPIVGILPPDFRFITPGDVFTTLAQGASKIYNDRTIHGIFVVARLTQAATVAAAQSELQAAQASLDHLYPTDDRNLGAEVVPLKSTIVGDTGSTLLLVLGGAAIVLLIGCSNVANLTLARSTARTREFVIRSALGASSARILRQLVAESLLLALSGGVLGIGLAKLSVSLLLSEFPDSLPRAEDIALDIPVLAFALIVTLGAGILFGLAPAFKHSGLGSSFRSIVPAQYGGLGNRTSIGGAATRHSIGQNVLVILQVALTLILLVGFGLLLRTMQQLGNVNPGFDAHNVLTFKVGLSPALTRSVSSTQLAFQQLLERLRHIPGVEAADVTNLVPLSEQDNGGPFWLGTQAPASPQDGPHALYFWTGPEYLKTMRIPLLRGRFFTPSDTANSQPVIVIDKVLADTWFKDTDPLGQTITVAHWGQARVIGVVGHVRHWGLNDPGTYNPSQIYICVYQLQQTFVRTLSSSLTIVLRSPLKQAAVIPAIQNAIDAAGKDQPLYKIKTIEKIVAASTASQRLPMLLLGTFAAVALLLASVGIYGVLSYAVTRRLPEIGIRMAVGANREDVMRMILGQGLCLTVAGMAIGTLAALAATRFLGSFSQLLYRIGAGDPPTFIAGSLVMIGAASLACYLPARRATQIDPMQALRSE